MQTSIPIFASSPLVPLAKPAVKFDFDQANLSMAKTADEGKLPELLFHCGQNLIMSARRNMPLNAEVAELVGRLLIICPEEVDLSKAYLMLKAYPAIRKLVESRVSAILANENEAGARSIIGALNQRMNRWGFYVPGDGSTFSLADFTRMPFPMSQNGRPVIETVWIEATNHCNQKCTFCPDPAREIPREMADFEQFKLRARELHDNFDIGYWQMNAYGEPLLHPRLPEMINYLRRELKSPAPVYFTSHGLTLTRPRIEKLLNALPNEIMISLHNDSQESYAITRSEKIGDYALLTERIFSMCSQLVAGSHPCSVRLSVLVNNEFADKRVSPHTLSAFAETPERFAALVMGWQQRFRDFAEAEGVTAMFPDLPFEHIARVYTTCDHGPEHIIPVVAWDTPEGQKIVFISPRPVSTYANLLPWQEDKQSITTFEAAPRGCGFPTNPSLSIFANGKLGICCMDLETTANFGHADDHATLVESFKTDQCRELYANIAFGIADNPGCAICLSDARTPDRPAA